MSLFEVKQVLKRWDTPFFSVLLGDNGYKVILHKTLTLFAGQTQQVLAESAQGGRLARHAGDRDNLGVLVSRENRRRKKLTVGGLTCKIKPICQKFEKTRGFRILVKQRAGDAMRQDARSEPLRNRSCGRKDCLCCSSGKPGSCEINSVGYRIQCKTCQRAGQNAIYEGESGRNAYSRGLEHQ